MRLLHDPLWQQRVNSNLQEINTRTTNSCRVAPRLPVRPWLSLYSKLRYRYQILLTYCVCHEQLVDHFWGLKVRDQCRGERNVRSFAFIFVSRSIYVEQREKKMILSPFCTQISRCLTQSGDYVCFNFLKDYTSANCVKAQGFLA